LSWEALHEKWPGHGSPAGGKMTFINAVVKPAKEFNRYPS